VLACGVHLIGWRLVLVHLAERVELSAFQGGGTLKWGGLLHNLKGLEFLVLFVAVAGAGVGNKI